MAKRLDQLGSELRKELRVIQKKIDFIVKDVANTVLESLVDNTPVDTSQALSNWIVTIDGPGFGTRAAFVLGKGGSSKAASASQTVSVGKAVIGLKRPGESIFITNNLDYIEQLNAGTISAQPGQFVEKAVAAGLQKLAIAKL